MLKFGEQYAGNSSEMRLLNGERHMSMLDKKTQTVHLMDLETEQVLPISVNGNSNKNRIFCIESMSKSSQVMMGDGAALRTMLPGG